MNPTNSVNELSLQGRKDLEISAAWKDTEREFLRTGRAADAQRGLTGIFETASTAAFQASLAPRLGIPAALVAAGDFARGEVFPHSTVDILIVVAGDVWPATTAIDDFLRQLWLNGVRPALRVYPAAEYVALPSRNPDLAIKLLDRRVLAGDPGLAAALERQLDASIANHRRDVLRRLVDQTRARHAKFQNTPAHREPDVEQGPGGLRDVRAVRCIEYLSGVRLLNPEALADAARFLSSVRCLMEYRAGEERSLFDHAAQQAIAARFDQEETGSLWMRRYFRHARNIFNAARHTLEVCEPKLISTPETDRGAESRESTHEFEVTDGRVRLRDPQAIDKDPDTVLRLLEFVARTGIPAPAETEDSLQAARTAVAGVYRQRPLWQTLKPLLALPYASLALRVLQNADLLSTVFPEWAQVEAVATADADQPFTMDEQSLMAVERICALRTGADAAVARFSQLYSEIEHPATVLFAALFHPLSQNHARAAAARIEAPQPEKDEFLFLLEQKSALAEMMSRDLNDPATVRRVADRIGTIERLKLLTVLTYGIIAQTSGLAALSFRLDQVWRAYLTFLRELTRELETDRIHDLPPALPESAEFIKGFPVRYLRAHTADEIAAHTRLHERSRPSGVAVQLDRIEGAHQLTVIANDRPGLFGSFAGAISSFGLNIIKAEAFSNSDRVVLDTFVFTDPKRALELNPPETERLQDLIARVGLGKTEARRLFRDRPRTAPQASTIDPKIQFDTEACESSTLVEIVAEDRPGLLYALATVFSSNACNIETVLIDTKGSRAMDVFYVSRDGRNLTPEFQQELKGKLVAACLGSSTALQV